MHTLERLLLFDDPEPRDGPDQMALDELLFTRTSDPILRIYRWSAAWSSFGISQSFATISRARPDVPVVRRWTGGGIVDHGRDWTFALMIPRHTVLGGLRPLDSYRAIHEAVATLIGGSRLAGKPGGAQSDACFSGPPACHDVVANDGRKLCGGAQRRTREGFLHQGSLAVSPVTSGLSWNLARALASHVVDWKPSEECLTTAAALACEKYATLKWTRRVE